jgi:chaperone modulatory protein CbpM
MTDRNEPTPEIVETLSLTELCRCCDVQEEWIVQLVDHGILEPVNTSGDTWLFHGMSITTACKARRLHVDLGINLPGIALALELLEQRRRLERRLASALVPPHHPVDIDLD